MEAIYGGGGYMMDRAARTNQGPRGKGVEASVHLKEGPERGRPQDFHSFSGPHPPPARRVQSADPGP